MTTDREPQQTDLPASGLPPNPAEKPLSLRARWVFPVVGPPIPGGCVTIGGTRIAAVDGVCSAPDAVDLGNVAILPGLVNAHTHLELSNLERPLGSPGISLPEWIGLVLRYRRSCSPDDLLRAIERGLAASTRLGTTLVGEIAQPGWPRRSFEQSPLGSVVFLELIAPTRDRVGGALASARAHLSRRPVGRQVALGLSPHAPYSVCKELLVQAAALSCTLQAPLAMHLAESPEEIELLRHGTGPMRQLLEQLGAWAPGEHAPSRPIDYLRPLVSAHRALVIHGNYLRTDEIDLLAAHRRRAAVVYCPRTHEYFGHAVYPLLQLLDAGVPVALGTDSCASSPNLSVLEEMRTVVRRHPEVAPHRVLAMATVFGAQALGFSEVAGGIEPGKAANLTVVALPDDRQPDPYRLLFDSTLPVVATWVSGACVWADQRLAEALQSPRLRQ